MTETMTRTEPTFPGIGSASEDTMRPQDLIPRFLDVLRQHDPRQREAEAAEHSTSYHPGTPIPHEAWADEDHEWWQSEECSEYLAELFDAMDELAPAYVMFGSREGDGADYGFWPLVEQALEDHDRVAQLRECGRLGGGLCLNGEQLGKDEDWEDRAAADGWEFVLSVNDHGNATLYRAEASSMAGGIMGYKELWAAV